MRGGKHFTAAILILLAVFFFVATFIKFAL